MGLPWLFAKAWRNCGIRLGATGIYRVSHRRDLTVGRRDCYVLLVVLRGIARLEHVLAGRLVLLPGDACLAPPGYGFNEELVPTDGDAVRFMADVTVIAPATVADPLASLGLPVVVSLGMDGVDGMAGRLDEIAAGFVDFQPIDETAALRARFGMDRLLLDWLETGFARGRLHFSGEAAPAWLLGLRARMRENLKRHDVTVTELAALAGVSPSHLQHACKRFLGESPLRLLRRLRMDVAAKLLASNPDLAVADVADRLGYRDQSLFARHFRSVVGSAPRAYRKGS